MGKSSLTKSVVGVVLVCALAVVTIYALDRLWQVHPALLFLIGFAAFFYALVTAIPHVVSRLLRGRQATHEQVQALRTWESPLPPEEALHSIIDAFQDTGTVVHIEANTVELALGSDVVLRRWGFYLEPGRRALPARLIVEATAQATGSRVAAEARDDIGWYYQGLHEHDRKKVAEALAELLDQAVSATRQVKQ